MPDEFNFGPLMVPVATRLWGDPRPGATKTEIRFGDGRTVNPVKGTFWFHGEDVGGGVLALVEREIGLKGRDAIEWLRREVGASIPETSSPHGAGRPRAPASSPAPRPAPTVPPAGEAPSEPDRGEPKKEIEKVFPYVDEKGSTIFEVVRFRLSYPDGSTGKTYGQRRPARSGDDPGKVKRGFVWSVGGDLVVPYRLPELLDAIAQGLTIFFVEGEKCADRLHDAGLPATCNPMGAGKWWDRLSHYFRGADLVIIPDNDPQAKKSDGTLRVHPDGRPVFVGRDHADLVAGKLQGIARRTRILDLPVPQDGSDAVEWFDAGGTAEALFDLVDAAAFDWIPPDAEAPFDEGHERLDGGEAPDPAQPAAPVFVNRFGGLSWADLDLPGPEHEWLVEDVLTMGETAIMAGASGTGKTFEALNLAMAIARGVPYWGRDVLHGGVVYQAGEGGKGVKKRIRAYREEHGLSAADRIPFVLMPNPVDLYAGEEQTTLFIAEAKHWATTFDVPVRLVVIDTLSSATPGADENSSKDVGPVLARCARITRETGATTLLVHHMNADGSKIRGHTSIKSNVDSVILVSMVEGHTDHHSPNGRAIREVRTDKVKDADNGQKWRFVLKSVDLGFDKRGKRITSCVVVPPDMGGREELTPEEATKGIRVSGKTAVFLRAIERALDEHGQDAPLSLKVPKGTRVVEWKAVAAEFAKLDTPDDDADLAKVAEARKKAITRAGDFLVANKIIMRQNPFLWLTGRKVAGFKSGGGRIAADPYAPREPGAPPEPIDDTF